MNKEPTKSPSVTWQLHRTNKPEYNDAMERLYKLSHQEKNNFVATPTCNSYWTSAWKKLRCCQR